MSLGPYALIRPLGKGGLGVVHLTEDPWSGRRIAIKLAGSARSAQKHLLSEHSILASLSLPVVPSCGRLGVMPDGQMYLTMEHIRGRGIMSTARRAGSPGSESRTRAVRQILRSLLRALAEVHSAGVLHGDLKTRNMRLNMAGAVRLLDFGAARRLDPKTGYADGTRFMGTPRYAPPEQRARQPLDVRSDLFSAGAMTVRLLTNEKPPWPPSPPSGIQDRELAQLLDVLLSHSPENRPLTATAALAMLPGQAPPLAAWWPGSARVYCDTSPARRRAREADLIAARALGWDLVIDGGELEQSIKSVFTTPEITAILIRDLHRSAEVGRHLLARLLRRADRLCRPLCLRATTAPDPTLRSDLPLAAFVPVPAPTDPATLDALCDGGQYTQVLERARGADPMIAAERSVLCAAVTCWRALGQIGEASRLIRTLEPLRSSREKALAADVALARGDRREAARLALQAGPESPHGAAIHWLATDTDVRPAGPWGAWCRRLRGESVDITALPEGWLLDAPTHCGEYEDALAWLHRHGLSDNPEAVGGIQSFFSRNFLMPHLHSVGD